MKKEYPFTAVVTSILLGFIPCISHAGISANGLITYFDFNSDSAADTSGALGGSASANDGSWTGTAVYKDGAFGRAVEVGDGAGSNFITSSGAEYEFGTATSCTVVYWLNTEAAVSGDPAVIAGGGKNWSSTGSALGWVSAIRDDDLKANIGDGSNRGDSGYIDIDHDAYWANRDLSLEPAERHLLDVGGDHWNFVAMVIDRDSQTLTNYAADEWVAVSSTSWASGVTGQDFGADASSPSTDADISDVGDLTAGNLNIVMGQDGDGAGYSLPASGLDDVSIWNRVLTRAELWEIYAEGRSNGKPLSAIVSTKICPATLQATLSSTDPYTVDLAWLAHQGLDSTGIEVLLGNDVITTLAADAAGYTHNPDLSAETGMVELDYTVRMTGGADSAGCDPITAKVLVNAGSLLEDLVLYLPLDSDSSDYSGKNNNGSLSGNPGFSVGQIGSSLTLEDTANPHQFVDLSSPSDLSFGTDTDFTVSVWVNNLGGFTDNRALGGSASDPAIASNKDWNSGANAGWVIAAGPDGRWQWNIGDGGARSDYDGPAGQINDGVWHHLLVSHDRDGMARLYYDGTEAASRNISAIGNLDSGYPTAVGTDGTLGAIWEAWFPGAIDEVAIWRRVVVPNEVAAITAAGTAGSPMIDTALELVITGIIYTDIEPNEIGLTFNGSSGKSFFLLGSTDLKNWVEVDDSVPGAGVGSTHNFTVDTTSEPARYYRLQEQAHDQ
ncbi:MAG: LamG domain-containing protein [Verrucomicrobiales bacterium]